jgi:DNA-binding NarL/FixJ family response regulator
MTPCIVADRHALFRSAVCGFIEAHVAVEVVAQVADTAAVLSAVDAHPGALLVIDSELPGGGLATCKALRDLDLAVRILVVGQVDEGRGVLDAMEAGADGFLDRFLSLDEVWRAFGDVLAGHAHVPPGMLAPLLRRLIDNNREADRLLELFMGLTRREREVTEMLLDGAGHREIAQGLVISQHTARTHVQNVLNKMGVHSRADLVSAVMRNGLLDRLQLRAS